MAAKIYPKTINGKEYYYLQYSYRKKINSNDSGKTKGSGKSKIKTNSVFLGTAESIKNKLLSSREPLEVKWRDFGFVSAIYNMSIETGLVELLQQHIKGKRYGIENWKYFLLAIINRLQHATSKEKMGEWAAKTVLPEIMGFDAKKLNSKSFWYATDDVISQKELEKTRETTDSKNDIFASIDDTIFQKIENSLIENILKKYELSPEIVLYDTTNFFTYFAPQTESELAHTGHNKAGRHNLRQIGLALCVDKQYGIPLYHQIYRGNCHDSKTFYEVILELLSTLKEKLKLSKDLLLIIDKGNNSEQNFKMLQNKIEWIGSLPLSNHKDLVDIPLNEYTGKFASFAFYSVHRNVFDQDLKLCLTFTDSLYRKQKHSFYNSIEKFKTQIQNKWSEYKKTPRQVPSGIETLLKQSSHKNYLSINCVKGKPEFIICKEKIVEKEKCWGKHILFDSNQTRDSSNIIELYHSKDKVEKGFQLIKDVDLIRWMPMRHWTDSKIRAFAFCCVMSLILIRIMELKLEKENFSMSPNVLKEELTDLKQIFMIYDKSNIKTKISSCSSVQKKLFDIFNLHTFEKLLTGH